jgi:hypothetical protein
MTRDHPAEVERRTLIERVIADVQDFGRLDAETRLRIAILLTSEGTRMAHRARTDLGLED